MTRGASGEVIWSSQAWKRAAPATEEKEKAQAATQAAVAE